MIADRLKQSILQYIIEGKTSTNIECRNLHMKDICKLVNGEKIKNVNLRYLDVKYLRTGFETKKITKGRLVKKGQIVILVDGENSGETFIIKEDGYLGSTFRIIDILIDLDKDFLMLLLLNAFLYLKSNKKGSAIPHLNKDLFNEIKVSLPTLEEQKKIVVKIEKIFNLIDEYKDSEEKLNTLEKSFKPNLEKSILQYAIEGKLVPQNPNDTPASILIYSIKKEKEKLIKDKVIKKSKSSEAIKEEEKHFKIPSSWEWVRLGEVVYNEGQCKPNQNFNYVDISSIDNINNKMSCNMNIIDKEKAPSRARKIVKNGDVLYSMVRPYLRNICIYDLSDEVYSIASTGFSVLRFFKGINKYLFYVLLSPYFDTYVSSKVLGTTYPAINDENFYKAIIPLPPLEEQKRIVAKIEELLEITKEL